MFSGGRERLGKMDTSTLVTTIAGLERCAVVYKHVGALVVAIIGLSASLEVCMTRAWMEKSGVTRGAGTSAWDVIMGGSMDNSQLGRTFDPGAAHISKTTWYGSMSRKSGGSIDTGSWRVMFPYEKESSYGLEIGW